MEMKYVVLKSRDFLIFPPTMEHASVVRREEITSAGFVEIIPDGPLLVRAHCHGESVSLNVTSDPKDSDLLTRALNKY